MATASSPYPGECAPLRDQGTLTDADQVARFASAVANNTTRVLDIDAVYESEYLKGARVLITGANRGVGLDLAKEAASKGAVVIGACRSSSKELDECASQVITGVDVTSVDDCMRMAEKLSGEAPVDILINNAGYFPDGADDFTSGPAYEEAIKQYDICALGPLRVSHALVSKGCIKSPGGKIIMITSQGGSITWRQVQNANEGTDYGHHMGKAAANMCGALMAEELRGKGIAVANLHPGFNRTDMTRKYEHIWDIEGAVEASVGAKRVWHEVGRVTLTQAGCPFVNCEDGLEIPN